LLNLFLADLAGPLSNGQWLMILGLLCGFYMAWSIGANDVANAMGTSVGSGALTLKRAIVIAAVMELAGAVLVGTHVTDTVRKGIFDPSALDPTLLALGFVASLLAAAVWLQVATYFGWPVSTTHSIVGAVVGVGAVIGGVDIIRWGKVGSITLSWLSSPLCGGLVAFLVFRLIQKRIIDRKHPLREAYRIIPFLAGYVGFVLSLVMVYKGLKNLHLNLSSGYALTVSVLTGAGFYGVASLWLRSRRRKIELERKERRVEINSEEEDGIPFVRKDDPDQRVELRPAVTEGSSLPAKRWEYRRHFEFEKVESLFGGLLILSACFLAFAHGANDVANAVGPLAAVVDITRTGAVDPKAQVPLWLLLIGGLGIVLGLATWGYRVMETIGTKVTKLTPSRAFAANVGAATAVVVASRLGFPISTTHTLVGAVIGIGLAHGIDYLNLRVIRNILVSWLITIPAGAGLAIATYYVLRVIFVS